MYSIRTFGKFFGHAKVIVGIYEWETKNGRRIGVCVGDRQVDAG